MRPASRSAVLALALAGCGYTFGSGLHEQGVRTVAVQVAGNETMRQRLEAELSVALSRELHAGSDLHMAPAGDADAVVELVLREAGEQALVVGGRQDPTREGALHAAVHMRLVRRDGKVLIDRTLLDRAEFRSPLGEDLGSARRELTDDLARKIALALATPF